MTAALEGVEPEVLPGAVVEELPLELVAEADPDDGILSSGLAIAAADETSEGGAFTREEMPSVAVLAAGQTFD
jgi:hypothetical protein